GDIHIEAVTGSLQTGAISTAGDVSLTAADSIVRDTGRITGRNINLEAHAGAIGSFEDAPVHIDTQGGRLTAHAGTDIAVTETDGDLRLNRVIAGTDVYIEVKNGALIDANTDEDVDQETMDELLARWDAMGLMGQEADD